MNVSSGDKITKTLSIKSLESSCKVNCVRHFLPLSKKLDTNSVGEGLYYSCCFRGFSSSCQKSPDGTEQLTAGCQEAERSVCTTEPAPFPFILPDDIRLQITVLLT